MYDWVLRLKHWQFFVIGFVVPALVAVTWMYYCFSRMFRYAGDVQRTPIQSELDFVSGIYDGLIFVYIAGLLTLALTCAWYGSIVARLGALAYPEDRPRAWVFKSFLLAYPIGSVLLVGGYYYFFTRFVYSPDMARLMNESGGWPWLYVGVLAFYALAFALLGVSIYVATAAARVYVSAQHPEYRDTGAVLVAIIAMLYWPIGIWFLQPKINVLAQAADDHARTGIPPLPREHYY